MRVVEAMKLNCLDVQKALGVEPHRPGQKTLDRFLEGIAVDGISTDSRAVKKGDLFFALEGTRFDGHNFVENALAGGAVGAVISKDINPAGGVVFKVKDTLHALADLAGYYRKRFTVWSVAVTGSNGKTTTKDILAECLMTKYTTLKTPGNFNNLIGVPLSVFGLEEGHEAAVFELGMSVAGEMTRLAEICLPNVAVFTNIAPVHLQTLGSIEAVARAKFELVESLLPDGTVILNADDDYLSGWRKSIRQEVVTYGLTSKADFSVNSIRVSSRGSSSFRLKGVEFELDLPGRHNIYNAAAAIAASCRLGCDINSLVKPLAGMKAPKLRSEVFESGGVTFLNDCYNSNPVSLRWAIDTLMERPARGRKIAVLADMLELGANEKAFHQEIGRYLESKGVDALFAFGELAQEFLEEYSTGHKEHFIDKSKLAESLKRFLRPGDVVLVKGSRAMALEEISDVFRGNC